MKKPTATQHVAERKPILYEALTPEDAILPRCLVVQVVPASVLAARWEERPAKGEEAK